MHFLGRWFSDAFVLAVSLLAAGIFMQVPAVTHAYASALLQLAQESQRDIAQREQVARDFYHLDGNEDAVIAELQLHEPANAQSLSQSIAASRGFQSSYERINTAPALSQPVTALLDATNDQGGTRWKVLRTTLASYAPEIILTLSGAIYALIGLVIGSLIAQLIVAPMRRPRPA
jgi:hypothetical protein